VPTLSVVIPAYEVADTVGEAVESALAQTVAPFEVIVVDDGSTDGTEEALRPYSERITLLSKDNGGPASARNLGVAHARGELVSFLDADDVYEPARIEALGRLAASRPDLDVLMTDAGLEVEGQVVGRFCAETPFAVDDQRLAILDRCFVVCPCVRRSRLLEAGGFDEALRLGEDWDCWLRLIMGGTRVGLVDAPLYRYRIPASSDVRTRPASLRGRVQLLEKASAMSDLSTEERAVLDRTLAVSRQRALLAEAEAALRAEAPDARRRSLAVALGPGFTLRARLKGLAAALAPGAAAERLARMEEQSGWSRLQRGYPRG
jgi:GT2 family glycosyltransferase